MRISAANAGWLIFLVAAAGAFLRREDDPLTAAMKFSGAYRPVLIGLWSFVGLMAIRIAFVMRRTARMGRQLEALRSRKGGR